MKNITLKYSRRSKNSGWWHRRIDEPTLYLCDYVLGEYFAIPSYVTEIWVTISEKPNIESYLFQIIPNWGVKIKHSNGRFEKHPTCMDTDDFLLKVKEQTKFSQLYISVRYNAK